MILATLVIPVYKSRGRRGGGARYSFLRPFLCFALLYVLYLSWRSKIFLRRRPSPESKMAPDLTRKWESSDYVRGGQFATIFRWRGGPMGVHGGSGAPYGGLVVVVSVKIRNL